MLASVQASARLGLQDMGTFSGSLAWPYIFPFPQRPAGLIETAFDELARRWMPILNACDEHNVNLCYEIHPGEDLHDGISFEMFLERTHHHPRCQILFDPSHFILQQLTIWNTSISIKILFGCSMLKMRSLTRQVAKGCMGAIKIGGDRAGRFRSTGDGQVDFKAIFSKLAHNDYQGWATLEWECCLKNKEDGASEGAEVYSTAYYPCY